MRADIKPSCVICAWRAGCQKQYSIADPSHCPDFSRDLSIKDAPGIKGAKVLVEGNPGSGKTTLIERAVARLKLRSGGFVSREIIKGGERVGFRITSLDKEEGVLAHVGQKGGLKVGRYTVNVEDLERIGVAALERAIRDDELVVIDEIGKMELVSGRFREAVEMALNSEKPLIATVAMEGPSFIDEVKARADVHLITLTPHNRDEALEKLLMHFQGGAG